MDRSSLSPAVRRLSADFLTGSRFALDQGALPDQTISERNALPDWRRPALLGYLLIILAFLVLGSWSALAKLAGDVIAPGMVTLNSSKKIIQHLESGIIAKILVHEGQHVTKGQVLFVLDDTAAQANAVEIQNQLYALLAQEARLLAERNDAQQVTYQPQLIKAEASSVVKHAMLDENKQFFEQRSSLAGEVNILNSQIQQLDTQIQGISDKKIAAKTQLGLVVYELSDLHYLLGRNLVQKTRVLSLESEKSRLNGLIRQADADIANARDKMGEIHLQIEQVGKKFSQEVDKQMLQVREQIATMRERLAVAQDVLRRSEIRAARAGTIQDLHVATIGGVISPGEPLAELIPDNENLIVMAQIRPADVDAIHAGMQVEVRLAAFHGYTLPLIMGRVDSVSEDQIINQHAHTAYFLARVIVDTKKVPTVVNRRIRAGMPAEIIVPTGERTVMSYLTRPLRNEASSAFREK